MAGQIVAIIPARAGSKGVKGKNVAPLAGFPTIAYTIQVCRMCKRVDRTIVSTDSEEIAEISRSYGAEVPFLRPKEIAGDRSTDIEFVDHALGWFEQNEGRVPDLLVHMRPTTPFREAPLVDEAIQRILDDSESTSLRSVQPLSDPPEKYFRMDEKGYLCGLFPNDPRPEYYNLPRQTFAPAFYPNGYVDILKSAYVKEFRTLHGPRMIAYVTPRVVEIDAQEDLDLLEFFSRSRTIPVLSELRNQYRNGNTWKPSTIQK